MKRHLSGFGRRLRQGRQAQQWTQDQLARRAGLSSHYVGRLERGEYDPTLGVVVRLARALRVDITSLVK
jgi:transcriptional regulator with XRE-family HTH domain